MESLRNSIDFLLLLSKIYSSIMKADLEDSDLVAFKERIENSIEYAPNNSPKAVHILIKYLDLYRDMNMFTAPREELLSNIALMLEKIDTNVYPINVDYYQKRYKASLSVAGDVPSQYEENLQAVKECKEACTPEVLMPEQVVCRANLLRFYLSAPKNFNDEIIALSKELSGYIALRNEENFNYDIF